MHFENPSTPQPSQSSTTYRDTKVLILGGGVAGVTAARTLHEEGIDFIVEARHELGGMMSHTFGENWTIATRRDISVRGAQGRYLRQLRIW